MAGGLDSNGAFARLDPGVQRQLWAMKWPELRDLQVKAIHRLLSGESHAILIAPTAAGKTEAAFLPILSTIAAEPSGSVRALYVGPLKALINDQFARVEELCTHLDVPVHRWHGDVPVAAKKHFVESPGGVLLITPESLESLFINRTRHLATLFGGLRFAVIDELHAFLDNERGRHLRSLLHRLTNVARFRTVGLSATIGDVAVAQRYVDRHRPESVEIIVAEGSEGELLCKLHGYEVGPSNFDETDDGPPDDVLRLADDLVRHNAGKSSLVFCNGKTRLEELADLAARIAERKQVHHLFFVHHGSLAADVRTETEEAMKTGVPATTFCTSTLEMGIDIGTVESVGQVGPPYTVASLKQRLGRSGRRGGPRILRLYVESPKPGPDASIFDRLHLNLIQSVAMTDLLLENWVEKPQPAEYDFSTLAQQVMSVIAETGGVGADLLYDRLCRNGAFPSIEPRLFAELLRSLAGHDVLEQSADGLLILGLRGEAIRKDKGFYAAFATPEDFPVFHDGRPIGRVGYIPAEHQKNEHLLLARRRWTIVAVDQERKEIHVVPSRGRKLPVFASGGAADLDPAVVERMRGVLSTEDGRVYLDSTAAGMLAHARRSARDAGVLDRSFVPIGRSQTALMVWAGSRVQATLVALFQNRGHVVQDEGIAIVVAQPLAELVATVNEFATGPISAEHLGERLAAGPARKYDHLLTDSLRRHSALRDRIDLEGARQALNSFVSNLGETRLPTPVPLRCSEELIAVIDVETTGLFPNRHDRVVEIAVVVIRTDGAIEREFATLVNPDRDIGPTRIHGLRSEDVAHAPQFSEIAGQLIEVLDGAFAVAGHNFHFDRRFLEAEFVRIGLSFPDGPSVCTMQLAAGGKLAECCREYGVAFDGKAHHALADARATAQLLAKLLTDQPTERLAWADCGPIQWPTFPRTDRQPVTRAESLRLQEEEPTILQRLIGRKQACGISPDDESALSYVTLLDRVLEDRCVTGTEGDALWEMAEELGLGGDRIASLHHEYLVQLARAALADGVVKETERRDLDLVSRLLSLPVCSTDRAIREAAAVPDKSPAIVPADFAMESWVGKRVCFSGELNCRHNGRPLTRERAEALATVAGLQIVDSVTKKLDVLVVADPNTRSGKAKKARLYGTRIMHEFVFWTGLGIAVER